MIADEHDEEVGAFLRRLRLEVGDDCNVLLPSKFRPGKSHLANVKKALTTSHKILVVISSRIIIEKDPLHVMMLLALDPLFADRVVPLLPPLREPVETPFQLSYKTPLDVRDDDLGNVRKFLVDKMSASLPPLPSPPPPPLPPALLPFDTAKVFKDFIRYIGPAKFKHLCSALCFFCVLYIVFYSILAAVVLFDVEEYLFNVVWTFCCVLLIHNVRSYVADLASRKGDSVLFLRQPQQGEEQFMVQELFLEPSEELTADKMIEELQGYLTSTAKTFLKSSVLNTGFQTLMLIAIFLVKLHNGWLSYTAIDWVMSLRDLIAIVSLQAALIPYRYDRNLLVGGYVMDKKVPLDSAIVKRIATKSKERMRTVIVLVFPVFLLYSVAGLIRLYNGMELLSVVHLICGALFLVMAGMSNCPSRSIQRYSIISNLVLLIILLLIIICLPSERYQAFFCIIDSSVLGIFVSLSSLYSFVLFILMELKLQGWPFVTKEKTY